MLSEVSYKKGLHTLALTAFVVGAYFLGWIDRVLEADKSYISVCLFCMFIIGLFNYWKDKWSTVNWIAEEALSVGLIGTVVGFIIALAGAGVEDVQSAASAKDLTFKLMSGMGTALYTTLVGGIIYLWFSFQSHVFKDTE